ncbi:MAG TPA: 4-carboxy-4-hydroxy-2-oxoadipate aldolase/oxaloacetate decarboxylase, partial [Magnetospirillaceae bacterium]|nr:4-carboxy-4-hydroxy-2-oxoadipate aldolase/oxaloacetate decarboxylase [Magnetospirillaceae bacterium]
MIHVLKAAAKVNPGIVEAFRSLDVATVYEASGRKGYIDCFIRPAYPSARVCGLAYTVQCAPADNLMLHKALQRAPSGVVLVAAVGGDHAYGYWGGMMAVAAQARGIAGLAIDGCVRDSAELARMGFPVFCRGFSVRGTAKSGLGLINYPLDFGLQSVFPGDLVLGDGDGMVVVRAADAAEILEKSLARKKFEEEKSAQL